LACWGSLLLVLAGLARPAQQADQPSAMNSLSEAQAVQLKYEVLDAVGGDTLCRPATAKEYTEERRAALQQFPEIARNQLLFDAITGRLGIKDTANLSAALKILIYRQARKLSLVSLEPANDRYKFTISGACGGGTSQGFIDSLGQVMTVAESGSSTGPASSIPALSTGSAASPAPAAAPRTKMIAPELRYRLIERFGQVWFCDPGAYPVARAGGAERALQGFARLQQDQDAYRAIAAHLRLPPAAELSDEQKKEAYQQYQRLQAISLDPVGDEYEFAITTRAGGAAADEGREGVRTQGLIDSQGRITVLRQSPAVLTCPICLAVNTRIDTPSGPVAVQDLKLGMMVWTLNAARQRVAAPVLKTGSALATPEHRMAHLVLQDGRELRASPGHPTADGRTVGQLQANAVYDSSTVRVAELTAYGGTKTYDLLPAGDTGLYWADGILLASTLR
jgi:hypothetical protein